MKLIEYELNKWINVDHVVKLSYVVSQEVQRGPKKTALQEQISPTPQKFVSKHALSLTLVDGKAQTINDVEVIDVIMTALKIKYTPV